ncbi:Maleylacetoacetate isomerase [Lamellibrachia satsuma]|nr:Maleylacetoacetate isomerase [Lamellibrachia satsuma]
MSDNKVILYSYYRSSASWRVRLALAFKNIDYEYRAVHLVKGGGEQHTDEYKTLNPSRQVPTLIIDGTTLTQSMAIIEYLEETKEGRHILPKDPVGRAQARRIAEMINSGIQPLQNLAVLEKLETFSDSGKKQEWGHFWIDRGFQAVEAVLASTSGKYCVGNEVSIADLCLVPQVYNAKRFKVDMSQFPTINRIHDDLIKMEQFKKADPACQLDCPEEAKKEPFF